MYIGFVGVSLFWAGGVGLGETQLPAFSRSWVSCFVLTFEHNVLFFNFCCKVLNSRL